MRKYVDLGVSSVKKVHNKAKILGIKNILLLCASILIVFISINIVWFMTLSIPTLNSFEERKVNQTTKIYDRTGKIVLYDIFENAKRTIIPFEDISPYIKQATISIEDKDFYSHGGIKISSFIRATLVNIMSLSFKQGGSTITQQVIKKTVLTDDKTPTRKLKEWILAIKIEKILTKDEILNLYLNEVPYGGSIYGVQEASRAYFGKDAKDVTVAEAAYLAALPQAPSFYSPYGKNKDKLEQRKNLVLEQMKQVGYIDEKTFEQAKNEKVVFLPQEEKGIKAPHFVMYIRDYLIDKYGEDVIETGGLKVTTTLDYDLQKKAEDIAYTYALQNKKNFNGENAAFMAIDPRTGEILTMVGSRNYFDKEIDGQFNITTAHRQPGSTFKPFVYAEAFVKGYTPETVLFDAKTQFSTKCSIDNTTSTNGCYSPDNYDNNFRGPMTLRDALAQSINIPAVKLLYLAGVKDSINLARSMGINSLSDANQYGLTLVLGGGEVSLLDMTSAYGVFANEGTRVPYTAILKIEDNKGNVLEEYKKSEEKVLDSEVARKISSILSDNVARTPGYGSNSPLYFPNNDVAVKTGTTNDYRDTWILGYTPNIVVGAWAGNNDNSPMEKKVAGLIVAPMWRAFMNEVVKVRPNEYFNKPQVEDSYALKPVLRGKWQGGISNLTADNQGTVAETLTGGVHSILYWVDKDNPRGPIPQNPDNDPQYKYWEYGVSKWLAEHPGFAQ
jgi:1A family penicillin-binding protein